MWSEIIRPKRGEDSAAELLLSSSSFPARVATIETACIAFKGLQQLMSIGVLTWSSNRNNHLESRLQ